MRLLASILLALCIFGSLISAITLPTSLVQLEADYSKAMETYSQLDEKERTLMDLVGKYIEEKKESITHPVAKSAPAKRDTPVYTDVQLANQDQFSLRQTALVDVSALLENFIGSACSLPFCASLISSALSDILPQVRLIQSLNADANATSAHLDLLVHALSFPGGSSTLNDILSNLGVALLPTTAVAYFSGNAQYTLNFNAANVNFDAQAFALLQAYSKVIEFNDANGNHAYDAGEEVSSIELSSVGWATSSIQTINVGSYKVYRVSSSTSDNVVTFTCDTSSYPVKDSQGQIISPNATKCTISIDNYQYQGTNSLIALEVNVVLVGGQFAGAATGDVTGNFLTVQNTAQGVVGGEFNWVPSVQSNGKDFTVHARASAGVNNGVVDLVSDILVTASGSTTKDAKVMYFTFKTGGNPSSLVWDPSVTYGEAPVESSSSQLTFSFFAFAAVIFALFWAL